MNFFSAEGPNDFFCVFHHAPQMINGRPLTRCQHASSVVYWQSAGNCIKLWCCCISINQLLMRGPVKTACLTVVDIVGWIRVYYKMQTLARNQVTCMLAGLLYHVYVIVISDPHPCINTINLLCIKTLERSCTSRIPLMYSPFAQKSFCHDGWTHVEKASRNAHTKSR